MSPVPRYTISRSAPALALVLLVLLDVVCAVALARGASVDAPTNHLDGAFQTYSGLARLRHGELPGRDFLPYLGIGPVLLLFPAFVLGGSTLGASVFSASFMTLISLEVAFGLLAVLVFRRRTLWFALVAAPLPVLGFVLTLHRPGVLELHLPQLPLSELVKLAEPGNSLRPIRSLIPYLLAVVPALRWPPTWGANRQLAAIGACAGIAAASWSNDYGIVSAFLLLLGTELWQLRLGTWRLGLSIRLWGSALVGFLVAALVLTAGHPWRYFLYNMRDVRGDQFWYFGPYAESTRIFGLSDLRAVLTWESAWLPLLLLAMLSLISIWRRQRELALLAYVGGALFAGGLVATVGGHMGGYFYPFGLWAWMVLVLVAVRGVLTVLRWSTARSRTLSTAAVATTLRAIGVASLIGLVSWTAATTFRDASTKRQARQADATKVWSPELGAYIDSSYATLLAEAERLPGSSVEEYTGLLTALRGPNKHVRVDSVIAALGEQRKAFERYVESGPDTVVTSSPEMTNWPTWNISVNWWFYRHLFSTYRPTVSSPTTLTWTRGPSATWRPAPCEVLRDTHQVVLPRTTAGMYEVRLDYSGPGRGRAFTMIQNNIVQAIIADGFLPLDPAATSTRFPVYSPRGGSLTLNTYDVPASKQHSLTTLHGCSARELADPPGADTIAKYLPVLRAAVTPAHYSDANWIEGVGRDFAGFFVMNTPGSRAAFEGVREVRFATGEVRKVARVEISSNFINVFLEGSPLDPYRVGFPHPYELRY